MISLSVVFGGGFHSVSIISCLVGSSCTVVNHMQWFISSQDITDVLAKPNNCAVAPFPSHELKDVELKRLEALN